MASADSACLTKASPWGRSTPWWTTNFSSGQKRRASWSQLPTTDMGTTRGVGGRGGEAAGGGWGVRGGGGGGGGGGRGWGWGGGGGGGGGGGWGRGGGGGGGGGGGREGAGGGVRRVRCRWS